MVVPHMTFLLHFGRSGPKIWPLHGAWLTVLGRLWRLEDIILNCAVANPKTQPQLNQIESPLAPHAFYRHNLKEVGSGV